MQNTSFRKEYNKLLNRMAIFKKQYISFLQIFDIKLFVTTLDLFIHYDDMTKRELNYISDIFILDEREYIPYIYTHQNKLKIKRKKFMLYIHPDSLMRYYNINDELKINIFTNIFQYVKDKNLSVFDSLCRIMDENEDIFHIIVNKMLLDNQISRNEINYIESQRKNMKYLQTNNDLINNSKCYDIFTLEMQYFHILYSNLNNATPHMRFMNDMKTIFSTIINFLSEQCKTVKCDFETNYNFYNINNTNINFYQLITAMNKIDNKYTKLLDFFSVIILFLPNLFVKNSNRNYHNTY